MPEDAAGAGDDHPEGAGRALRARGRGRGLPAGRGGRARGGRRRRPSGETTSPPRWRASAGPARALLAAERTALNLLCHLSGVATLTARFVQRGRGHRRPDPRHAQDHAGTEGAGEGGGRGRRRHQPPDGPLRRDPDQGEPRRAGGRAWGRRSRRAREAQPGLPVEVECRDLDEVAAGRRGRSRPAAARQHDARRSCARPSRRRASAGGPELEASGGVTLETVAEIAATAWISSRSGR